MDSIEHARAFMRSNFASVHMAHSDQYRGVPPPPLELPHAADARVLALPKPDAGVATKKDLFACLHDRRSRRGFAATPLSLAELSFLLWATQGVEKVLGNGKATLRTVPSGGARHPFETYLVVSRVTGVDPGLWRYLPLAHQLLWLRDAKGLAEGLVQAACDQGFVAQGAVAFVWSCVPYRGEWRYQAAAHRVMLLDAGHVCQNLYLACESIGCGACAIAAFDQEASDALLGLNGQEEFVVYMAPVGKVT